MANALVKKGFHSIFILGLFAGPRAWRNWWWQKAIRWNWLAADRSLYGPQWLERSILDKATRRLPLASGRDRIFLLRLIMQHAYAFEGDWHREFIDEALRGHYEFLDYVFQFPHFIDSLLRQDQIIGFIERLFADLDALHDKPLEPKIRARLAKQIAENFSFMPALFSEANLRPLAQTAGRWVDTFLRLEGLEVDYEFPPPVLDARLRVGVYVHDIEPRNESFISVPFGLGLDRARFKSILITGKAPSDCAFGAFVKQSFECIEVIPEQMDARVAAVRALNLDFLILGNSIVAQATEAQRFLSYRLARRQILPVAISPSTTGLKATNYVLTARNTEDPDKVQDHYTETVHWLEGTFNCFHFGPRDPRRAEKVEPVRTPRRPIVFASGGVIYKLGPALRQSFVRILKAVPDSELLLYPFNPNWSLNPKALTLRQALLEQFTKEGIEADRIQILPAMSPAQILKLMAQVTVYLDTFPFSGGASVMEPVFAACPIVTLQGHMQRGLLGTGMMRALGMDEFVAKDVAEYETKAIEIARSPERRTELAEKLRLAAETASFLNPALFGQRLGAALEKLASVPDPAMLMKAARSDEARES